MSQSQIIKQEILRCLDIGMDDKQKIYAKVVETLGVPRPTVRRVARDLKVELIEKVKILDAEVVKSH